ncbi:MAG: hypothetical protein L7U72_18395, partial [Rubripirellula sp.]|nr:hypothetical protein [Rubripirellula sp.]
MTRKLTSCVVLFLMLAATYGVNTKSEGVPQTGLDGRKGDGEKLLAKVGHPLFCSPHFSPIAIHGDRVFVVNTPSDTVDVLDRQTRDLVSRINVGVDPVSI